MLSKSDIIIMSSILIHIVRGVSCHQASSHCLTNSTVRRSIESVWPSRAFIYQKGVSFRVECQARVEVVSSFIGKIYFVAVKWCEVMMTPYLKALLTRASFPKSSPSLSWHTTPWWLMKKDKMFFPTSFWHWIILLYISIKIITYHISFQPVISSKHRRVN